MEGQSITLKIAGKEYSLKAQSPEDEQLMRLAAGDVNSMLSYYNANYPNQEDMDKLAFVTLTQAMSKIREQRSAAKLASELDALDDKLGAYLAGIEKNR
ncbi:MAG: cell division protein ZapA [Candidatus Cryptobacteroides sp.]|jgi:hypothetical protein|nr:cell division protein ZapA [Rikenellaceae bacterium]